MARILENALWDIPDNKWELREDYLNESQDKKVADGKNILAVVEGVFFVPDGVSRNERFYPKRFWEIILSDSNLKQRLDDKMLFGTIGHAEKAVDEDDIANGMVSHIVTKLWIDENNRGMGQAYILGTQAGRNLYCIMKAGARIKTSSRASGDYKSNEDYNGMPIVDENNYYLETFDFVINPGFVETNPMIKENVNKIKEDMRRQEMEFGKELLEHIKKEKEELSEAVIKLREDKAVVESKNQELQEKVNLLESKVKELSEAEEKVNKIQEELTTIKEELTNKSEKLTAYEAISNGNIEDLKESLDKSAELLEQYVGFGKPESIKESIELNKRYSKLGKIEDLEETLPVVEEVLEEIAQLGTLSEVKEIIDRANELTAKIKNEQFEDLVIKISREYKAPIENTRKLLESVGEKQTIELLKNVNELNKKVIKEEIKKPVEAQKQPKVMSESKNKPAVFNYFKSIQKKSI